MERDDTLIALLRKALVCTHKIERCRLGGFGELSCFTHALVKFFGADFHLILEFIFADQNIKGNHGDVQCLVFLSRHIERRVYNNCKSHVLLLPSTHMPSSFHAHLLSLSN